MQIFERILKEKCDVNMLLNISANFNKNACWTLLLTLNTWFDDGEIILTMKILNWILF